MQTNKDLGYAHMSCEKSTSASGSLTLNAEMGHKNGNWRIYSYLSWLDNHQLAQVYDECCARGNDQFEVIEQWVEQALSIGWDTQGVSRMSMELREVAHEESDNLVDDEE